MTKWTLFRCWPIQRVRTTRHCRSLNQLKFWQLPDNPINPFYSCSVPANSLSVEVVLLTGPKTTMLFRRFLKLLSSSLLFGNSLIGSWGTESYTHSATPIFRGVVCWNSLPYLTRIAAVSHVKECGRQDWHELYLSSWSNIWWWMLHILRIMEDPSDYHIEQLSHFCVNLSLGVYYIYKHILCYVADCFLCSCVIDVFHRVHAYCK